MRFITYSGYHAHRYTERWHAEVLWSETPYVDITVEDSLPEEMWIVYIFVFWFPSGWKICLFTLSQKIVLWHFSLFTVDLCTIFHFLSWFRQLHFSPSATSICQVMIAGSILILPHGDPATSIGSVWLLERNDGLHLLQHTGQTHTLLWSPDTRCFITKDSFSHDLMVSFSFQKNKTTHQRNSYNESIDQINSFLIEGILELPQRTCPQRRAWLDAIQPYFFLSSCAD